ncbi:putative phage abortive infection protein [Acinetobacter tandoii]|uniref:putative phage abortive infection protein n=1 Tax=Acinetobacter tandoii TaxID=202954 RepID=UPI003017CDE8
MTEPLKPSNDNKNELAELKQQMFYSKLIVGGIITIVLILYFSNFHNSVSIENGDWGTFGDFVGGILNPIIAAFALYWLITSVNLQIQELKKTNEALERTVETAKKQQDQVSIQNFENLFFQLIKAKNEALENIQHTEKKSDKNENLISGNSTKSVDAIKNHIIEFKNSPKNDWNKYYEENMIDYTSSYFGICYHLIDIIENNECFDYSSERKIHKELLKKKQKLYFDIFKSTLTKHELEAFFFNFINAHSNKPLKRIIEKYQFFNNLPIDHDRSYEKSHRLTRYAYHYDPITFEENSSWKNYFSEVSKIDITISLQDLECTFQKLKSIGIIKPSIIYGFFPNFFESTSGFCHQFNENINSKNIYNIFSEENLNKIKISTPYTNPLSEISIRKQSIEAIDIFIKECITWFEKNDIQDYNEKIAEIGFPEDRKSIKKLNEIKENHKAELNKYNEAIKDLDQKLNSVQQSKDTLTVFILIKYGISFTEYCDYINSKQTIDNPTQQS